MRQRLTFFLVCLFLVPQRNLMKDLNEGRIPTAWQRYVTPPGVSLQAWFEDFGMWSIVRHVRRPDSGNCIHGFPFSFQ